VAPTCATPESHLEVRHVRPAACCALLQPRVRAEAVAAGPSGG